jgi:hypothetical protein
MERRRSPGSPTGRGPRTPVRWAAILALAACLAQPVGSARAQAQGPPAAADDLFAESDGDEQDESAALVGIGRLVDAMRPKLAALARLAPDGVQLDVNGPLVPVVDGDGYAAVMGEAAPADLVFAGGTVLATPRLGVLNVTGPPDGALTVEYRPERGGTRVVLVVGEHLRIAVGLPPATVLRGLVRIFRDDGTLAKDYTGVSVEVIRSLTYFDSAGRPRAPAPPRVVAAPLSD